MSANARAAIAKAEDGDDVRFGEWCKKVMKDIAESPPVGFPCGDILCPQCGKGDVELRPHLNLAQCRDCKHTWTLHVVSIQEGG